MASIIIPASKSITVTDKFPNENINEVILSVGNDGFYNYLSYLFFDISTIPSNVIICHAELVLFKVDEFYNDDSKVFEIYPLTEYFSTYTNYNNRPEVNNVFKKFKSDFYPLTSKAAVTVPLTSLVTLWVKYGSINTSIMLCGKSENVLVHFGSAICTDKYLIPFLKVTFTPCYNPVVPPSCTHNCNDATLRQINVTGTVAEQSKYDAVVNIGISRNGSNHTDNYCVVDEYDNSTNHIPLHVDKTYNIAIIPPKTSGDAENITFYGSYKE